jgi:parallel beta-helix repeat protein
MTIIDRRYSVAEGQAVKAPCRAATTANITLSGQQTIDGVAVVEGDRVLVKNQSTASENGIYTVSTGPWTRPRDFDGSYDVVTGTRVYVTGGSLSANIEYCISTTGEIVIGTTAINWTSSGLQAITSATAAAASAAAASSSASSASSSASAASSSASAAATSASAASASAVSIDAAFYDTRALAAAATIPASAGVAWIAGLAGGRYVRVGSNPGHFASFQDASGAWFEFDEKIITPYHTGCVGDGSTDDSTNLQRWLDACGLLDRCGHLAKGTYKIPSAGLTLPDGVHFTGDGAASVIQRTTNVATPLILGTSLTDVIVDGWSMTYTPTSTPTVNGDHCAFRFNLCTRSQISNCNVTGRFYVGIEDRGGTHNKVFHNYVRGCRNRGVYISSFTIGVGPQVVGNNIDGRRIADGVGDTDYGINTNGFGVGGITEILYSGNFVSNTIAHGISIGDRCYGSIVNNVIASVTDGIQASGILVQKANTFSTSDIVVSGNKVTGSDIGILVTECSSVAITGNTVVSSISHGIYVNTSTSVSVTGNTSRANGGEGILVVNVSSGCSVTGNIATGNTSHGFLSDVTCSRIVRGGNVFLSNTAGNVSDSSTSGNSTATDIVA